MASNVLNRKTEVYRRCSRCSADLAPQRSAGFVPAARKSRGPWTAGPRYRLVGQSHFLRLAEQPWLLECDGQWFVQPGTSLCSQFDGVCASSAQPPFCVVISDMKFKDAVRHLESLGLAVVMPDGKLHRTGRRLRLRNPRSVVPVRILKKGALPQDLRQMIHQSRAEADPSAERRRND